MLIIKFRTEEILYCFEGCFKKAIALKVILKLIKPETTEKVWGQS
jgi:hypothetical protein